MRSMDISPQFIDRIDLRARLRRLCFSCPYDPDCDAEQNSVYTDTEIAEQPIKWLKYLLLDRTGVESIGKVSKQIHRFPLNDIEAAEDWALNRMRIASDCNRHRMVVGKLVPWDQGAQIKNYRMLSIEDVHEAFMEIRSDIGRGAHELWCCESDTDKSGLNLGGRLNYPRDCGTQTLELVWYASPRLIENVRIAGFEHPYLRAERSAADPQFRITKLHVPARYHAENKADAWQIDFHEVLWLLGVRQTAMQRLVALLHRFGAKEVCFCFKVTNGYLTVIDWDTEIESSDVAR